MSIQVRSNVFFENIFHTYLDLEIMSTTHTLYLNGVAVSGTNSLSIVNNKLSGLVAPTADTDAANMGYVKQQISELVGSAPELLNTLHELSLAIGSDPNFASSTANLIGVNTSTIANEVSRATAAEAAAKSEAIVAAASSALSAVQTSTNENHSELVAHVQAIWDYFFAPRVDGIPKTQPERYVAPA